MEVFVACDKSGKGDFFGLSPKNAQNSEVCLETADKVHPDIIHVQFEPGMYGLVIDNINPSKTITHIDSFYKKSGYPIVTTFHTLYDFRQWISQGTHIKKTGKTKQFGIPLRVPHQALEILLELQNIPKPKQRKACPKQGGNSIFAIRLKTDWWWCKSNISRGGARHWPQPQIN